MPQDWIEALFRKDSNPQKTDRFWCSALVGIIYNKLGIIQEYTDWTIMRPSDFSVESNNEYINFNGLNGKHQVTHSQIFKEGIINLDSINSNNASYFK